MDDDSTRLAGHTSYQYDRIISIAILLATLVVGGVRERTEPMDVLEFVDIIFYHGMCKV